jgi:hypothetical protein
LLERLAALVPPPKFNIVRYSGVFAPAAGCRSLIVPQVKPAAPPLHGGCQAAVEMQKTESGKAKERRGCQPRNYPWAQLMTRVFGFDVLTCPRFGAKMRILAAINPPCHWRIAKFGTISSAFERCRQDHQIHPVIVSQ